MHFFSKGAILYLANFLMQIKTINTDTYRGCRYYIRNFESVFEYLVIIKDELYTWHSVITKSPFKKDYTKKQLEDIIKVVTVFVKTTVDVVLDGNKE